MIGDEVCYRGLEFLGRQASILAIESEELPNDLSFIFVDTELSARLIWMLSETTSAFCRVIRNAAFEVGQRFGDRKCEREEDDEHSPKMRHQKVCRIELE